MADARAPTGSRWTIEPSGLAASIERFYAMIAAHEPGRRRFVNFRQGVIDGEEGYKLRVRDEALRRMRTGTWSEMQIGQGALLEAMISGIEINEPGMRNNLLQWEPRNGPGTEAHVRMLEARQNSSLCAKIENLLFQLYHGPEEDLPDLFAEYISVFGRAYPLISYLWFLRSAERFVPVRPEGLQQGLAHLGIDLQLINRCSWENYQAFIAVLEALRPKLSEALDVDDVRLIDAHSFIWVVGAWSKPKVGHSSGVSTYGEVEKAAFIIARNILATVASANGQMEMRQVKEKVTDMSAEELKEHVEELLRTGNGRCAISGLPYLLPPDKSDPDMVASPDRIDSSRGYERGNIQIVCWFINRWKGDDTQLNFTRLLERIRHRPESI